MVACPAVDQHSADCRGASHSAQRFAYSPPRDPLEHVPTCHAAQRSLFWLHSFSPRLGQGHQRLREHAVFFAMGAHGEAP